jgi:hypothetical protein
MGWKQFCRLRVVAFPASRRSIGAMTSHGYARSAVFGACLAVLAISSAPAAANGGMTCTFDSGVIKTFENGVFKDEKVEPLSFRIEDVDLVRQTASLRTKQGKGDLKIVRAIGANHFLEVVTEGFLNMTTVYEAAGPGAPLPAVHSRHFGFFGAPFVSQYHGTCVEN